MILVALLVNEFNGTTNLHFCFKFSYNHRTQNKMIPLEFLFSPSLIVLLALACFVPTSQKEYVLITPHFINEIPVSVQQLFLIFAFKTSECVSFLIIGDNLWSSVSKEFQSETEMCN